MNKRNEVTNIVVAGLGGQGVLTATDIIAGAAFHAGFDVKKSEIHGMSQRGGSVTSDVRFGKEVWSPMVPPGEADYLVLLDEGQRDVNRALLAPHGIFIHPAMLDASRLPSRRSLNMALAGVLSAYLAIPEDSWMEAIRCTFPERLHAANFSAFRQGREAGQKLLEAGRNSHA